MGWHVQLWRRHHRYKHIHIHDLIRFDSIRMDARSNLSIFNNECYPFFLYCTLTNQLANHQVSSFELNVYKTKLEARCLFVWPKKSRRKRRIIYPEISKCFGIGKKRSKSAPYYRLLLQHFFVLLRWYGAQWTCFVTDSFFLSLSFSLSHILYSLGRPAQVESLKHQRRSRRTWFSCQLNYGIVPVNTHRICLASLYICGFVCST